MCQIEGCLFYETDAAELLNVLSANKSMINNWEMHFKPE